MLRQATGRRCSRDVVGQTTYEYKFVRLGEGWLSARKEASHRYQEVVHQHARDGWRLVQVFAPGMGVYGAAKYFEAIFERPVRGEAGQPSSERS
jgi:hypothetical protein